MIVIDRETLERTLTLEDALQSQRDAFRALAAGAVSLPLRSRFDWPAIRACTLVMPALQAGHPLLCIKIVQVSDSRGVTGQILAIDTRTQAPVAVMDAEAITLLRTAAASALSALHLTPPRVDVVAVFGTGHQAAAHVQALRHAGIGGRFRIWGRNPAHADQLAARLGAAIDAEVRAVHDPRSALRGAQLVCTCTPAAAPLFAAQDLDEDVHLIAMGGYRPDMCELPPDAFRQAFVCVDQREAAKAEAGDLLAADRAGMLDWSAVRELGEVLERSRSARPARRTVFKSLGLAVQDHALARLALRKLGHFAA
jgi:ornithine cyclodeaminase/alanine dehydrogenase-like protein (mu-crystallin family)